MRTKSTLLLTVAIFFVVGALAPTAVFASSPAGRTSGVLGDYATAFADHNTVGLWLFDETEYPYTTLTDAGPYEYDLRLMDKGSLVPGKFGSALLVLPGYSHAVCYAGFKGGVPAFHLREADGVPSGLYGPTEGPGKLLHALDGAAWTCEFWLKLLSVPDGNAVVIDLGQAYDPGFSVSLKSAGGNFEVNNAYAGMRTVCPTSLTAGQWLHVAFVRDGTVVRHFIDGVEQASPSVSSMPEQPLPDLQIPYCRVDEHRGFASMTLEQRVQNRFNFSVGCNRQVDYRLYAIADELRFSDVVRYSGNFTPPASFSCNYGSDPPWANGPTRLFSGPPDAPRPLGSRKHLFIDDALIETKSNLPLKINPPTAPQPINQYFWADYCVFDHNGKVHLVQPDGYFSCRGITELWTSEDGLNFYTPDLGVIEYQGDTHNNFIMIGAPMWCTLFKDTNPNVRSEERFKLTGWVANRGIYLYLSPDGIRWRRNETCMLPLVSGGGCETFWDDQRGRYVNFLKRDSSFNFPGCGGGGRRSVRFESRDAFKAWPFDILPDPYFEAWPFPAVTCEGPVIFAPNIHGQVYRSRAIKYPWAPDAYLAFIWRYDTDSCRQTELGVSRDGINWTFYSDQPLYLAATGEYVEAMAAYGLIRRGDEIWQYVDYGTGSHGGGHRDTKRVIQRLDGFVSLDAAEVIGTATTLPLVYEGNRLVLNAAATGSVRVGILNEAGEPLPGLDVNDCDPVQGDSVEHVVTWDGNSNVGGPSGNTVRLRFELQNAKLYSFQFRRCADLDNTGQVDMADLDVMSSHWLDENFSSEPVFPGQLVAWWEFEEGGGAAAYDSAGDNHGATIGDPNWVTGRVGSYALEFDGAGDAVIVPDKNNVFDMEYSITIAAWVKLDSLDTYYFLVNKQPSGNAGRNYPGNYSFRVSPSGGRLELSHQTSFYETFSTYTSTSGVEAGVWHHVAVTLQQMGDVRFYIDGAPAGTSPQFDAFGIVNNEPLKIGVRKDIFSFFDGAIDDIRIYRNALRPQDVQRIYEGILLVDFPCLGNPFGDLNDDCRVNFSDFAVFALEWLKNCL
ncbi:MAG: LamG domain-containing protein [Planctomycetota bacterium]|jgi:hypothetical protein